MNLVHINIIFPIIQGLRWHEVFEKQNPHNN